MARTTVPLSQSGPGPFLIKLLLIDRDWRSAHSECIENLKLGSAPALSIKPISMSLTANDLWYKSLRKPVGERRMEDSRRNTEKQKRISKICHNKVVKRYNS